MASIPTFSDSQQPENKEFGFNLISWDQTVDAQAWIDAVREMYRVGVSSFTIVTYRFVNKATGVISPLSMYKLAPPPPNQVIRAAIAEGTRLGMRVSLNPFIEIDNPNGIGHEWRGMLSFSNDDLPIFFRHYQAYIVEMAQLARDTQANRLYIGSELKALSGNPKAKAYWLSLIREARSLLIDRGTLTYAANHDEYTSISFWQELDEIGIDAYFVLATQAEAEGVGKPAPHIIGANWQRFLKQLKRFSQRQSKPIILSEWGTVPFDLTTHQPWNWQSSMIQDTEEQRNAYQATIEAVAAEGPWLRGIQFWHWGMKGNLSSHYSVKPESELARFIARTLMDQEH